jgi:hypothetical protein
MAGDIQLLNQEPVVLEAVDRIKSNEQSIEELDSPDWSKTSQSGYQPQLSGLPF